MFDERLNARPDPQQMTELLFLLLWHTRSATAAQLPPPEAWQHADALTKRIDPAVYPGIPDGSPPN
jgi:hypothetical protein